MTPSGGSSQEDQQPSESRYSPVFADRGRATGKLSSTGKQGQWPRIIPLSVLFTLVPTACSHSGSCKRTAEFTGDSLRIMPRGSRLSHLLRGSLAGRKENQGLCMYRSVFQRPQDQQGIWNRPEPVVEPRQAILTKPGFL